MNFKSLLQKLTEARTASEAFTRTGEATRKDAAKASAPDVRAKDAARKRAERARQVPRERKPKTELVKEIIAVRTKSGEVQLIFKDSFDASRHTKISDQELTIPEAKQLTSDPKFEQTRASMLLLGDVKKKEPTEKEKKEKGPEEKEEAKPAAEEPKAPKAKKLSPQQMMQAMSQMDPVQLASVPADIRQQYFQSTRNPPSTKDFDHFSYEELSVKYGINPASDLPYNQQVLNALVFLAKTKAGASEQEMMTYSVMSPNAMQFTRAAFGQARKILAQIGDQCIQNLVTSIEAGSKEIDSEGFSDMQCGNYRFKVSAGGEMSISTTAFDQSNKHFRGFLGNALTNALQKQLENPTNEKVIQIFDGINQSTANFSQKLISNQALQAILSNEKYVKILQKTPVVDAEGNNQGTVLDENGNLNPLASLESYQQQISNSKNDLLKTFKAEKGNDFSKLISANLLKMMLRGDGIVQPETAPNHLITINGIFPMTDEYFAEIASTSTLEGKPAKDTISVDNIANYKPKAAERLRQFSAIIEAKEQKPKMPSLEELMVSKDQINIPQVLAQSVATSFDFDFNSSLLPGFSPKDINAIEYNYVKIGGKTTKIPVERNESISKKLLGEECFIVNDLLIESLTNNFIISALLKSGLINEVEADILDNGVVELMESADAAEINLRTIYRNVNNRIDEEPYKFSKLINMLNGIDEEYKRDYKMEYRNYHGKPKQRKERAARTKAREILKKKGIVKKGDGKDIDHKKPLRSGGSNGINNLRVRNKSNNRSDNGHKKGEKQNKDWK